MRVPLANCCSLWYDKKRKKPGGDCRLHPRRYPERKRYHGSKEARKDRKAAPVTGAQEEKLKALEHALADLDKQFGKGAVMKLGEHAEQNVQVIPTGCLTLDEALGVGGIPRGRIVEIFGPESSGKTTVALHIVAQAQKMGGIAAFVDAEHASTRCTPRIWA